jgi:quercetin dioxygenase-like cupin family protein
LSKSQEELKMRVIRIDQTRETSTPNATMRTLASPELAGTSLSMWRVAMDPGQRGPEHMFDTEQVWTVIDGQMDALSEGSIERLRPGDAVVFPAGGLRQVACAGEDVMHAIVVCAAGARASTPSDGDRGTPPWIL